VLIESGGASKQNLPGPTTSKEGDTTSQPKSKSTVSIDDSFAIEVQRHGAPAVSPDGSRVFVGGINGVLHCFEASTGKTLWRKTAKGGFDSDPALDGDSVFMGSSDGMLYSLRASDGKVLWSQRLNGALDGRPVVAGDRVLVATDLNTVVCLVAQ